MHAKQWFAEGTWGYGSGFVAIIVAVVVRLTLDPSFGTHSPFNPDAASPPAIVLDGETIGYLTVSPVLDDAVDPVSMLTHIGCEPPS